MLSKLNQFFFIFLIVTGPLIFFKSGLTLGLDVYNTKPESLHLHQILLDIKEQLVADKAASDADDESEELLKLISEELDLFHEVVESFNNGNAKYLQLRFIALCNYFKRNKDSIAPKHIREFESKLEKFNAYVKKYLAERRSILSKDDITLCEKMHKFNEILISNFLEYEYFDIGIGSIIRDWILDRPFGVAKENPIPAACAVAVPVVILGGMYWQGRKTAPLSYRSFSDDCGPLDTGCREIKFEPPIEPQNGGKCGKHALMNIAFWVENWMGDCSRKIEEKNAAWAKRIKKDGQDAAAVTFEDLDNQDIMSIVEMEKSKDGSTWENVYIIADSNELYSLYVEMLAATNEVFISKLLEKINYLDLNARRAGTNIENLPYSETYDISQQVWSVFVAYLRRNRAEYETQRANGNDIALKGIVRQGLLKEIDLKYPGLISKLSRNDTVFYIINLATNVGQLAEYGVGFQGGYGHWIACKDDALGLFIRNSAHDPGFLSHHGEKMQCLAAFSHMARSIKADAP